MINIQVEHHHLEEAKDMKKDQVMKDQDMKKEEVLIPKRSEERMDSVVSGTMVPAPLTSASSSMKNPLFADIKKGAEILQHAGFFT